MCFHEECCLFSVKKFFKLCGLFFNGALDFVAANALAAWKAMVELDAKHFFKELQEILEIIR